MVRSPASIWLAPVLVTAVFALQLSASLPAPGWYASAACLAGILVFAGLGLSRRSVNVSGGLLLAGAALAAWAWAGSQANQRLLQRLDPAQEGVELSVQGVIDELPTRLHDGWRFGFRVDAGQVRQGVAALPPRLQLSWHSGRPGRAQALPDLSAGQQWLFTVKLKRPHAPHNPGGFDRELRWLQEGVGAIGSVRGGQLLNPQVPGAMLQIERWRGEVRAAVLRATGPGREQASGILAALAIGDQAAIDPALWTLFNQTGVGHLMSISGLHITMLAGLGGTLAGRLWQMRCLSGLSLPTRIPAHVVRLSAAVVVAFAYALLAGWGIPAQRTCFMLAVAAALLGSGRTASIGAAVGLAAAAVVCLDPWAPLAAGFWLSFGAVLAIVWVASGLAHGFSRFARALDAAVRTQWAATVSLLPLGAWFFGSISIVGPLANAVSIPLVSALVTPLALAGGALALMWPALASWVLWPAALITQGLLLFLNWLASWSFASVALPRPDLPVLMLATVGCALLLAPPGFPRRFLGALALLPMLAMPLERPGPHDIWLTALDVGQGTAVVIQAGGRTLVYDTGPGMGAGADAAARVIVPWLSGQGIARPDALLVSHLDNDHSGGVQTLLKRMPPDWVATSVPAGHAVLAGARQVLPCHRGEHWQWGEVRFEFLHPADPPEPARGSPTNALSCVLRIHGAAGSILLTGDIESAQEQRLVTLYGETGLGADVLLAPHHGSRTSSSEAFLDAVRPRLAVFQAAYRSRFNHPHPTVLARYEQRGIGVLRSDADGAIRIRLSPGQAPAISRSRHEPPRYWRIEALPRDG